MCLTGAVLLKPVQEIAAAGANVEHARPLQLDTGISERLQKCALDYLHVRDVAGVVPAIRARPRRITLLVRCADPLELGLGHDAKTSGSRSNASTAR